MLFRSGLDDTALSIRYPKGLPGFHRPNYRTVITGYGSLSLPICARFSGSVLWSEIVIAGSDVDFMLIIEKEDSITLFGSSPTEIENG